MGLGDVRLPGLAFVAGGRVMSLLVLYLFAKRLILLLAFLSVMLLLPKDGGGLHRSLRCSVCLVCPINLGAGDASQHRKDGKKDFGVDEFQHRVSELGMIGLPGPTVIRGARVIHGALLLNKCGG